jgi:hypothetical protein
MCVEAGSRRTFGRAVGKVVAQRQADLEQAARIRRLCCRMDRVSSKQRWPPLSPLGVACCCCWCARVGRWGWGTMRRTGPGNDGLHVRHVVVVDNHFDAFKGLALKVLQLLGQSLQHGWRKVFRRRLGRGRATGLTQARSASAFEGGRGRRTHHQHNTNHVVPCV